MRACVPLQNKTVWDLKTASKSMQRESEKCEKKEKEYQKKAVAAMKKNQPEQIRIHTVSAIREKNQAIKFALLSSRMDAISGRVEGAIRMKTVCRCCCTAALLRRHGRENDWKIDCGRRRRSASLTTSERELKVQSRSGHGGTDKLSTLAASLHRIQQERDSDTRQSKSLTL